MRLLLNKDYLYILDHCSGFFYSIDLFHNICLFWCQYLTQRSVGWKWNLQCYFSAVSPMLKFYLRLEKSFHPLVHLKEPLTEYHTCAAIRFKGAANP